MTSSAEGLRCRTAKAAEEIYLVASREIMARYVANNICNGVKRFATNGIACFGGIICNSHNVDDEYELIDHFAGGIGTWMTHFVPRA